MDYEISREEGKFMSDDKRRSDSFYTGRYKQMYAINKQAH